MTIRDKIYRVLWIIDCFVLLGLIGLFFLARPAAQEPPVCTTLPEMDPGAWAYDIEEDPFEAQKIADAVAAAIGTVREEECLGFDATHVMQVLTHEAGHDPEVARGVTQALWNACVKEGGRMSPEEIIIEYQYADPLNWISDEVREAFEEIFVRGERYEPVEDATVFYAPMFGWSSYHESEYCELIIEINGVRFYREVEP